MKLDDERFRAARTFITREIHVHSTVGAILDHGNVFKEHRIHNQLFRPGGYKKMRASRKKFAIF